jgi:hypothetical protein
MDANALPVSPEDLYARLGTAKAPLLIDVRRHEAFDPGQLLIIGVHGHEVSQGVASALRGVGMSASYLAGLRRVAGAKVANADQAADTSRPDLTPQGEGLLAISYGLSANFPDDHEMLKHGLVMYDALYTWCRMQVDGKGAH